LFDNEIIYEKGASKTIGEKNHQPQRTEKSTVIATGAPDTRHGSAGRQGRRTARRPRLLMRKRQYAGQEQRSEAPNVWLG
jgi:hypothetical protein